MSMSVLRISLMRFITALPQCRVGASAIGVLLPVFLLLQTALFLPSAGSQQDKAENTVPGTQTKEAEIAVAPVVLDGQTIFLVRERFFSFMPEDRAKVITEKISALARNPLISSKSIITINGETTTDIVADDRVIMTVTDGDAKSEGMNRQELATHYAEKIRGAIDNWKKQYSVRTIIRNSVLAFAVTLAMVLALILLKKAFAKLYVILFSWKDTRIPSLRIQKLEVLSSAQMTLSLIRIAKIFRLLVTVLLFYFYIPLVLSFFPWTRGISSQILHYVLYPLSTVWTSFITYIPDLFFILVILIITRYVIKAVKFIFTEIYKGRVIIPGFYADWAFPTFKIVRFLIIVFAVVVIFPYLPGAESPAFKGISIFVGVLFSLGSTSAVSNVVAGLIITYMRAFKIGDRVRISDTVGDVIHKDLLVTRIQTIKNVEVTIPNASVLSSHIVNYSTSAKDFGLVLHTTVTIGYDAPWRKVHELLIAAADATEHILKSPKPFVLQTALNDFYVSYELNAHTDRPLMMARIYSELHQNIQDKFNEAGLEIMSPHYSALRDGNETTIPPENRPNEYRPFGFRISGPPKTSQNPGERDC